MMSVSCMGEDFPDAMRARGVKVPFLFGAKNLERAIDRPNKWTEAPRHLRADKAEDKNPDLHDAHGLSWVEFEFIAHLAQAVPESGHGPNSRESHHRDVREFYEVVTGIGDDEEQND